VLFIHDIMESLAFPVDVSLPWPLLALDTFYLVQISLCMLVLCSHFYLCDAMLAQVLAVALCLSVTSQSSVEMAERIVLFLA